MGNALQAEGEKEQVKNQEQKLQRKHAKEQESWEVTTSGLTRNWRRFKGERGLQAAGVSGDLVVDGNRQHTRTER